MKTIKQLSCLALFAVGFLAPSSVFASSILFQSAAITSSVNGTFSVPVSIDPENEEKYTVQLVLEYPPEMLEVTAFTFAGDWMPLSQPGYDSTDNSIGSLIKTAGFPSGFSSRVPFGTVTFHTKQAGDGIIKIGSDTLILNAENISTLESSPSILVVAPASPSSIFLPPLSVPILPSTEVIPEFIPSEITEAEQEEAGSTIERNLFDISAGAGPAKTLNRSGWIILILILSIAFGVGGFMIFEDWRKRRILKRKI